MLSLPSWLWPRLVIKPGVELSVSHGHRLMTGSGLMIGSDAGCHQLRPVTQDRVMPDTG